MKDAQKRLSRLQKVASLMADVAMAPVAAATAEVRRIEAQIEALATHRAQLTAAMSDPSIAGTMLAQAERLRVQQANALTALASAHVRLDATRRAAAKAVGRTNALDAMADKQAAALLLEAKRKRLR